MTNGIGGYASGTVAGSLARRYHGLLVAALAPPVGRRLLVAKVDEVATYRGTATELGTNRWASGALAPTGYAVLERFHLEGAIPVWTFAFADALLEKRVWMEYGRNVTGVEYRLVRATAPVGLAIRILVNDRDHHALTQAGEGPMEVWSDGGALVVRAFAGAAPIRLAADRGTLVPRGEWYRGFALVRETERGLGDRDDHRCAAEWQVELAAVGDCAVLTLAADAAPVVPDGLGRVAARAADLLARARRVGAEPLPDWIEQLVLAADAFVVARPIADDPAARSVIAGYPWFGDWGRDTMIALPGLALATGNLPLAHAVLRTFARFIDGGMLPNVFPDAGTAPAYNSVDAALWFVEAVRAVDEVSDDREFARELFAPMTAIVDAYLRGTRYGIHVDPDDGLLSAGAPGWQLTWMDAKVGDWVVTPRSGKPVEVNALWYNALRTLESFADRDGDPSAARFGAAAARAAAGFERFWNAARAYPYDVLDGPDGDDPAIRPNALLAAALASSPLTLERRRAIVRRCGEQLLTSYGLRSLAPDEPGYRGRYRGDIAARDGAYHQGTAWGWLIGPWIAALLACGVSAQVARTYLEPFRHHLQRYGVGTLAEIADGDAPFVPNGAIAQAWTVGAVLAGWRATSVSRSAR